MKYLKIKTTDKKIIIIDLEKVVSYMVGDDFVNVNYYGNDFFHFTKEVDKFGIQVEKFETLRVFIQNLALGEERWLKDQKILLLGKVAKEYAKNWKGVELMKTQEQIQTEIDRLNKSNFRMGIGGVEWKEKIL